MKIIKTIEEWKNIRLSIKNPIGFIPSMGCLHEGHASLLKKSKEENETTVLSIFINPIQFNDKSDFIHYPKTEKEDLDLARSLEVDFVFIPSAEEIYADQYNFKMTSTHPLSQIMEGKSRPGHFDGMLTVVLKLLQLVKPQRAYFGEKDFQQLHLVKAMVKSFFIDTEIISCPTIRLKERLPLSSRNKRLSTEDMEKAKKFSEIFHHASSVEEIKENFQREGIEFDYVESHDEHFFTAVRISGVRLIDHRDMLK